ncbi:hypothetical protein MACJ_003475 [Theileria orientalis]|uniref:Uncharacterized protein n=1 Tax=Theileria orientalis TaxID=68886 RepID=A0A976XKA5_THEOR|nr:hypothetical protein MACJ_003475 [Theileria orientalis]
MNNLKQLLYCSIITAVLLKSLTMFTSSFKHFK